MKAELIHSLNSDDGIVDAARVSFDKAAENFSEDQNAKLISYLIKHVHWAPIAHPRIAFGLGIYDANWLHFLENANLAGFTWAKNAFGHDVVLSGSLWAWHQNRNWLTPQIDDTISNYLTKKYPIAGPKLFGPQISEDWGNVGGYAEPLELPAGSESQYPQLHYVSFRITAPIFIARQMVKHQVGLVWNEVSRRYVDAAPSLWVPGGKHWRLRADKVKQGSSDETTDFAFQKTWDETQEQALFLYDEMLKAGIAPEDARIGLPLNMETSWIWTGHLLAFKRVLKERLDPHAQKYTRDLAEQMYAALSDRFHSTWQSIFGART